MILEFPVFGSLQYWTLVKLWTSRSRLATYPFVVQLEDFGEEEKKDVGPGVSVTVRLQRQEVTQRFTTNTGEHRQKFTYVGQVCASILSVSLLLVIAMQKYLILMTFWEHDVS